VVGGKEKHWQEEKKGQGILDFRPGKGETKKNNIKTMEYHMHAALEERRKYFHLSFYGYHKVAGMFQFPLLLLDSRCSSAASRVISGISGNRERLRMGCFPWVV
jgi:hypothetical protein